MFIIKNLDFAENLCHGNLVQNPKTLTELDLEINSELHLKGTAS
jgi:hypothetical protein